MKFGFDLDGVLDRPEMAAVANALTAAGHEVVVITGGLADQGEWTEQARHEKLARCGVEKYTLRRCFGGDLHAVGAEKARACRELGVVGIFEDSALYAQHIRGNGTPCWLV